jgi:hypothetical protein
VNEARGVEQDVHRADPISDRPDRGAVAHVEFGHLGDAFVLQRGEAFLVDVGRKYRCALARKGDRTGAADAGGSGGDKGALALEAVGHGGSSEFILIICFVIPGRA